MDNIKRATAHCDTTKWWILGTTYTHGYWTYENNLFITWSCCSLVTNNRLRDENIVLIMIWKLPGYNCTYLNVPILLLYDFVIMANKDI